MIKRIGSLIVVALIAGFVLAACGSPKEGEEATVTRVPVGFTPVATPEVAASETTGGGGEALPTTIEIDMVDIAFQPTEITIPADTEVTIKLVNKGAAQHNFNIDALNVKSDTYNGGESGEIKITAKAGEYEYHCAIPGHKEAGMVGKLKVVAAGGAATAAPASTGASTLPTTVEVDMVDIAFEPTEITIPADTEVTIKLVSKGAAQHNFNIDALNVKSDTLNGGESGEVKFTAKAGEYDYYCAIPGHKEAGMVGKLKVVAAAGSTGGSSASASSAAAATSLTIDAEDIAWSETELTAAAGTEVTITITNKGAIQHAFNIDALKVSSGLIDSTKSATVTFTAAAGTYEFYCPVRGHKEGGMVGTLTVK